MAVEVVIPFSGDCEHRARALSFTVGRWRSDGYPVTVAGTEGAEWCKAAAVNPAASSSTAEVLIVADADVLCAPEAVEAAVRAVQSGERQWAVPHRSVHRLAEESTSAVLAGADPAGLPLSERAYLGVLGGGVIVAARETLLDTGPFDPRFTGWGQEDECAAIALTCLHGEPWRGKAALYHCWHPPQPRLTRRRGSRPSWDLRRRYIAARRDPALMRALIEEVTDPCPSPNC